MESCTRLHRGSGHDLQYICENFRIQEASLGRRWWRIGKADCAGKRYHEYLMWASTFEFVWFFDVLVDNFPQYVPICKPIRRIGCQKRNWLLRCRECCPLSFSQKLLSFWWRTLTFAALDTNASVLARMFWILAQHQDAQNRLRIEIREAKQDGNDLTYDQLEKLPYLDAICRETLRLSVVIPYQELSC